MSVPPQGVGNQRPIIDLFGEVKGTTVIPLNTGISSAIELVKYQLIPPAGGSDQLTWLRSATITALMRRIAGAGFVSFAFLESVDGITWTSVTGSSTSSGSFAAVTLSVNADSLNPTSRFIAISVYCTTEATTSGEVQTSSAWADMIIPGGWTAVKIT